MMLVPNNGGGPHIALPLDWRLVRFDTVDSTNEQARRLAGSGAAHGTVVWADVQTGGRGRRGRTWSSPLGNLHCSILVRPRRGVREAAQLSLVAGVAVAEALSDVAAGVGFRCKWPNDILCRGRKLCGILLEGGEGASVGGTSAWVVIGIGVDVASAPSDGVLYPTTSLVAEGCGAGVGTVLAAVCHRLNEWVNLWHDEGFSPVRSAWQAAAGGVGEPVTVRVEEGRDPVRGTLVGLDDDGALLVAVAPGLPPQRILAGDVIGNDVG